jgi:hypothetical protein
MSEIVLDHIERALVEYTSGDHYQTMINAKNEYFSVTGQIFEEDEDYESRMSCFNDWYILQFQPEKVENTFMESYLTHNEVEDTVLKSLKTMNHSLFEYLGTNFSKNFVLKDILHDKKVILPKDHSNIPLLKNDLFVGRVLDFSGANVLMSGLSILPKEVKSILKKESKKVRKNPEDRSELEFLLQIEALKTKWSRYGHVDIKKIFDFSSLKK